MQGGAGIMEFKARIMDEKAMQRAIARISFEIIERNRGTDNLCILGILRRGAVIGQRIAAKIEEIEQHPVDVGVLDITPYRDDIEQFNDKDLTDITFSLVGRNVVLVDDVVHTGRSVRAAIDAVMSRGRPQTIQLASLIDRGHRELPIRPDYVGKNAPTSSSELVRVCVEEYDGINQVDILAKEGMD